MTELKKPDRDILLFFGIVARKECSRFYRRD